MSAQAIARVVQDLVTLAAKNPEALTLVAKVVRAVVTGRDPVETARRAAGAVAARKGAHAVADAALKLAKKAKG